MEVHSGNVIFETDLSMEIAAVNYSFLILHNVGEETFREDRSIITIWKYLQVGHIDEWESSITYDLKKLGPAIVAESTPSTSIRESESIFLFHSPNAECEAQKHRIHQ